MKGFVRILEAVIASFVILISLSYFISAPASYDYWDASLLRIQAQDALASLYKSGLLENYIMNNDVDGINNTLTAMLPGTADFSVEIKGMPSTIIYIGCDCSDAELTSLENMLGKTGGEIRLTYNGREIEIRVSKASIDNIDPRTDIYFMFDYTDLNPYKDKMNGFLQNCGTLFMLADFNDRSEIEDGILDETFGLEWTSTIASISGKFYNHADVTKQAHWTRKYFLGLPGDESTIEFNNGRGVVNDYRTIIIDDTDQVSKVKINELNCGRTVWFADYNEFDANMNELLKALILWSSDNGYRLDPSYKTAMIDKLKTSDIPYTEASYLLPNYEVTLRLWGIFY
jgi:hypothetical protein